LGWRIAVVVGALELRVGAGVAAVARVGVVDVVEVFAGTAGVTSGIC
jgi:hypothetical protein